MTSIEISAPAKVNLFFKILSKRRDSYHNILTLFERISLADTITISKRKSGVSLKSDKLITADHKDNLAYKAAELLLKHSRIRSGVSVYIKKRIPIASGLGGGNSDAASVLMGINKLYNLRIPKPELMKLALKLGADVPFFILEEPFAVARSVGEALEPVNLKLRPWHIIVYSGKKTSTRDMYEAFDAVKMGSVLKGRKGKKTSDLALTLRQGSRSSTERFKASKCLTSEGGDDKIQPPLKYSMDFESLEALLYNDLEDVAVSKDTVIDNTIQRLASSLGRKAILSGSGPSVFCLCRTRKEAIKYRKRLFDTVPANELTGWQVFIAKTEG